MLCFVELRVLFFLFETTSVLKALLKAVSGDTRRLCNVNSTGTQSRTGAKPSPSQAGPTDRHALFIREPKQSPRKFSGQNHRFDAYRVK